jgi:peptide/nickel transport system permease protein
MSGSIAANVSSVTTSSPGLWALAWRRLRGDRLAMAALAVVGVFVATLLLSFSGIIVRDWDAEVGVNYAPPTFVGEQTAEERGVTGLDTVASEVPENPRDPLRDILRQLRAERAKSGAAGRSVAAPVDMYGIVDPIGAEVAELQSTLGKAGKGDTAIVRQATLPFGADKWGHDIIKKTVKGSETSIIVGFAAALLATVLGTIFGAISGYYGKWVDDLFNWFYSVFTSVPYLLLILAVAAVLQQKGVLTIVLILGLTGWTGVYRLIRAEYIKHKGREYVMAADAIGASDSSRMFRHIFPNVSHVAFVQMSILTVGFIKSEVILSFLGFGVPVGVASWGSMLNEAQNELILGKWWQLVAATFTMAVLVTAFSIFTDALRDALDPKLK